VKLEKRVVAQKVITESGDNLQMFGGMILEKAVENRFFT